MTAEDFKVGILPLKNKIFRFAKRLLDIHADAEDLTQEVFIRLWNKRSDLGHVQNLEAYTMLVTKNMCIDKIRGAKMVMRPLPDQATLSAGTDPGRNTDQRDQKTLINLLIGQLPEQQKMVIQLRDIEGYEFEEIAAITGMTENTARVNLSRARKTLREGILKTNNYGLG